ncbi:MAG: hypothetical protein ACOCQD_01915 [archaeon]
MPTSKKSFAPVFSNRFSRKWGGTHDAVDPYVSGYFWTHFAYLPPTLSQWATSGASTTRKSLSITEIRRLLTGACQSVTIPGAVVNKSEFNGLGAIRWSVPANVDWDNVTTMRFIEFSSTPILGIFHGWVKMMRDYRTGTSRLSEYKRHNYASTVYYWTTTPNARDVEAAWCMTGVFPQKDPTDMFGHDLTALEKIEVDIDFNVDYVFHENWVYNQAQEYGNAIAQDGDQIIAGRYGSNHQTYHTAPATTS